MKQDVEATRRASREENKKKGMAFLAEGNLSAANDCFAKAVDVTTEMAVRLIRVLQAQGVECIVAPYEADAQLAYLSITDYVDVIITEDSDLLPFGAKTVFFKMDKLGEGQEVVLADLQQCQQPRFAGWTHEQFLHMCILSGCDYTPTIPGLGLRRAFAYLANLKCISKVLKVLRLEKSIVLPAGYEERFEQAQLTFLHQRVYCPHTRAAVPLRPIPAHLNSDAMDFIGPPLPADIAHAIATAVIDPFSKQPYPPSPPPRAPAANKLAWKTKIAPPPAALPVQKNKLTTYFIASSLATARPFVAPIAPVARASSLSSFGSVDLVADSEGEQEPEVSRGKPADEASPELVELEAAPAAATSTPAINGLKRPREEPSSSMLVPNTPSPVKPPLLISKFFSARRILQPLFGDAPSGAGIVSPTPPLSAAAAAATPGALSVVSAGGSPARPIDLSQEAENDPEVLVEVQELHSSTTSLAESGAPSAARSDSLPKVSAYQSPLVTSQRLSLQSLTAKFAPVKARQLCSPYFAQPKKKCG
jgi:exonuclease-1